MERKQQPIYNINTYHSETPSPDKALVGRLLPDKKIFLKSNQIITKYVNQNNVRYNQLHKSNSLHSNSAYVCVLMMVGSKNWITGAISRPSGG